VPLLTWLSGLTCTDENFVHKAGAQRAAARTVWRCWRRTRARAARPSRRPGRAAWDLGLGAGFYVNATQAPWSTHYRMYDYVLERTAGAGGDSQPVDLGRQAIFGHSMGGHGALTLALRNPGRFAQRLGLCADLRPEPVPLGREGLGALPRCGSTSCGGRTTAAP
jgi:S-formylglutathione hydrolase